MKAKKPDEPRESKEKEEGTGEALVEDNLDHNLDHTSSQEQPVDAGVDKNDVDTTSGMISEGSRLVIICYYGEVNQT